MSLNIIYLKGRQKMPVECYSTKKECPRCKNNITFIVNDKKYFCAKCLGEFEI